MINFRSWTKYLFQKNRINQEVDRRDRFQNVMKRARAIAEIDPLGLSSLVRLIARSLQAKAMISVANQPQHGARAAFDMSIIFGSLSSQISPDGKTFWDLMEPKADCYCLKLGRDPVLAVAWDEDRFVTALASIGHARKAGKWREDSNHSVTLLYPFGLGLVNSGNHSITAGIANCEGTVTTTEVIDLSNLYEYIRYDGSYMLRIHDGSKLYRPDEEEFGIIFEIGRLMLDCRVCYDASLACVQENDDRNDDVICYRVFFDKRDTGYSLSSSGAVRLLSQAGITLGGAQARSILVEGEPFLIKFNNIKKLVKLEHYVRRPLTDDLEKIYDFSNLS